MNYYKLILLLVCFCLGSLTQGHSQESALGENLIPTGDFEQAGANGFPLGWTSYGSGTINYSSTETQRPQGTGSKVIEITPRGMTQLRWQGQRITLDPQKKYILSFWHKATTTAGTDIVLLAKWYNTGEAYHTKQTMYPRQLPLSSLVSQQDKERLILTMKTDTEWQQVWLPIELPQEARQGATEMTIDVVILRGSALMLDDLMLQAVQGETFPKQPEHPGGNKTQPVSGLKLTPYQREIEVRWDAPQNPETTWELTLGNKTYTTDKPNLVIENLEPKSKYQFSIRALLNGVYSVAQERNVETDALRYEADDIERIPYLRAINSSGRCPKILPLYYSDLANPQAEINYWIDDVPTQPQAGKLHFPSTGSHRLRLRIVESSDKIWEIDYEIEIF